METFEVIFLCFGPLSHLQVQIIWKVFIFKKIMVIYGKNFDLEKLKLVFHNAVKPEYNGHP